MAYKDYLQSDYWRNRRQQIIDKYKGCQICSSYCRLEVHHRYYSNGSEKRILGKEPDYLLILLCHECHNLWHNMYGKVKMRADKIKKIKKQLLKGKTRFEAFSSLPTISLLIEGGEQTTHQPLSASAMLHRSY